ncbi:hypothetical protein Tco_0922737 [Tanacetum coccineum]|uniref:Uncharacterized protein n=1 Tax=Tanacetum coccineum TaxID=301880 RepID=A0ABQ5CZZ5_9ASTR
MHPRVSTKQEVSRSLSTKSQEILRKPLTLGRVDQTSIGHELKPSQAPKMAHSQHNLLIHPMDPPIIYQELRGNDCNTIVEDEEIVENESRDSETIVEEDESSDMGCNDETSNPGDRACEDEREIREE